MSVPAVGDNGLMLNGKFIKTVLKSENENEVQGIVFNGGVANATSVQVIPTTFTSEWTDFDSMFHNCYNVTTIPQFDTSSGTNFDSMFALCESLTTVPQFDTSSGVNFSFMFYGCTSLTTFGGLLNCKKSYDLSYSTNLTHDSLMNAINGLYDLTGQTGQTLTLGTRNLAKLTNEEKAIATNKNWTLA